MWVLVRDTAITGGCMSPRFRLFVAALVLPGMFSSIAARAQSDSGQSDSQQSQSETSDGLQEIVVTGIRKSIQAAQEIKRESPSVVEAITLQDLGKFTDSSITDALQRLPGVNIDTSPIVGYGGYSSVAIRGLGADYSSTTFNGRDALGTPGFSGAGGRNFDFAAIPPDILAAVTVYKTSTSERVQPGMAGQVDLQTLRPLDYAARNSGNYFGSIAAGASQYAGEGKLGSHFNGIVGGKFLDGLVGAYLSASDIIDHIHRTEYQTYSNQYNIGIQDTSGNVKQYNNVWSTWGTDSWNTRDTYEKFAAAGALQIKPGENLDINIDALYNHYTIDQNSQSDYYQNSGIFSLSSASIAQPGAAVIGGQAVPGVTDGGLRYFDTGGISNIASPGSPNSGSLSYAAPFQDGNDYHYFFGGVNAVWKSSDERFKVSGDVSHGDNEYFTNWLRPYLQNGIGGDSIFDARGSGIPQYTFINTPDTDVSKPGSYTSYGFVEHFNKLARGDRNTYRIDFAVKFTDGLTGKFGVNREVSSNRFIAMNFDPTTFPSVVPSDFFVSGSSSMAGWPVTLPNASLANFCAANPVFCNQTNRYVGSMAGGFPTRASTAGGSSPYVPATAGDTFDFNTTESYQVREGITALYGQLDFKGEIFGGTKYSGNAGLRAVRVSEDGLAFQGVAYLLGYTSGGVISSSVDPVEEKNSYWEYLPSVNLIFNPLDNLAIRIGGSKTISLASPKDLAPLGTINIILPTSSGIAQPSVANTNNPFLKPTSANNYDVTAEYYTSYGGAYIGSVFHKDVSDLIEQVVQPNSTIPGQGSRLFVLSSVINGAKGHVNGFELGTNQPLVFLPSPWDGFGVQANYTYVDTQTNVNGFATQFVGSSKQNVNVNAYFEKAGFSARLAYLHRSSYVADFNNGVDIARPQNNLDASVSQKFLGNYEVILTGSNLLGTNLIYDSQQGGFLSTYIQRPRSYTLALRARF